MKKLWALFCALLIMNVSAGTLEGTFDITADRATVVIGVQSQVLATATQPSYFDGWEHGPHLAWLLSVPPHDYTLITNPPWLLSASLPTGIVTNSGPASLTAVTASAITSTTLRVSGIITNTITVAAPASGVHGFDNSAGGEMTSGSASYFHVYAWKYIPNDPQERIVYSATYLNLQNLPMGNPLHYRYYLAWSPVAGAEGYRVYVAGGSPYLSGKSVWLSASTTNLVFTGANTGFQSTTDAMPEASPYTSVRTNSPTLEVWGPVLLNGATPASTMLLAEHTSNEAIHVSTQDRLDWGQASIVPITVNTDYTVAEGQKDCVFYYTGTGPLRLTLPTLVVGRRFGIINATTNAIDIWPVGAGVKIDACGVGAPLWNSGRDHINKEPFSSVSLLAVSSTWWFIPAQGRGEWTQTEL